MKINNNTPALFFLLPGICYLIEYVVWKFFPPSYGLNGILGGLWTLAQIGILVMISALYRHRIANGNIGRVAGAVIASAGAISYSINYIFGHWLHMNTKLFLPMGALLTGIGMVVTGIQVLHARQWQGASRFLPLLVGLYPFTVMFPLLLITGHPDITAILGWGIPWLALGVGMALSGKRMNSPAHQLGNTHDAIRM